MNLSFLLVAAISLITDLTASEIFTQHPNDKEVLDILLHNKRYDYRIKPPSSGNPLRVNISVVLLSLSSPDESSLHYEVEFLMHQRWIDPRLTQNNHSRNTFLNGLHHHTDIWKPDIYFIKHGTFKENLTPSNIALRIFTNGTVLYSMRRHLVLNCEGDLHIFPFDSPMCTFSIESVSFTSDQMAFHWAGPNRIAKDEDSGNIALSPVLKRHNAYLVHNETFDCNAEDEWRGDYSCLKVRLHFTRDKAFYVTTVFIPGIILVSSSFLTFWFEWNSVPARTMLGVTTMLNFFTTSNGFRSNLPVVSNLTAMNLWDAVCMFFIYTSFLEFVIMNYLARWVQDPEEQKKKKDNPILDSLQLVSTTLDLSHPNKSGTLGGQLHSLGGNLENRFKEVRNFGGDAMKKRGPRKDGEVDQQSTPQIANDRHNNKSVDDIMSDSTITNAANSSQGSENEKNDAKGRYSLTQVKKIDMYSRRIFPCLYGIFVLYFFTRYSAIEGAMSIGGDE
jgi:cation transporter family protein